MIKIYVGCSLAHATDKFLEEISDLKKEIRKIENIELLEFVGKTGGVEKDVYFHDIHNCVMKADLFVAEVSEPSLGLGWELGTAVELRKIPTLVFAKEDAKISRLVVGATFGNKNYYFFRYKNIEEIIDQIKKQVQILINNRV